MGIAPQFGRSATYFGFVSIPLNALIHSALLCDIRAISDRTDQFSPLSILYTHTHTQPYRIHTMWVWCRYGSMSMGLPAVSVHKNLDGSSRRIRRSRPNKSGTHTSAISLRLPRDCRHCGEDIYEGVRAGLVWGGKRRTSAYSLYVRPKLYILRAVRAIAGRQNVVSTRRCGRKRADSEKLYNADSKNLCAILSHSRCNIL